jgi:hypothetical protein
MRHSKLGIMIASLPLSLGAAFGVARAETEAARVLPANRSATGRAVSKRNDRSKARTRRRHAMGGSSSLLMGTWGGPHVVLNVTPEGATLEYDCAHGTMDGRVVADRNGRFDLRGTHEGESGGVAVGSIAADEGAGARPVAHGVGSRPARYVGRVKGQALQLTVTLLDTGETFGTFSLTRGSSQRLYKCQR